MSEYKKASTFPPWKLLQCFFFFFFFEMTVPLVLHKFTSDSVKVNFSQKANSAAVSGTLFLSVLILSHFANPLFILSFSRSCLSWFRNNKHIRYFWCRMAPCSFFSLFQYSNILWDIKILCFDKFHKLPHNDHFCVYI